MSCFYLVLTDFVHNNDLTGYRGLDRGDARFPYFKQHEAIDPRLNGKDEGADDEGCFAMREDAVRFQQFCRELGIRCETIYGREIGAAQGDELSRLESLGFDVCQRDTGSNSAIVNLCMPLWEGEPGSLTKPGYATIRCVSLHFDSLLNKHRLFDNQANAEFFVRVNHEIDERFWNSSEKQLQLAVLEVYCVT